MTPAEAVREWRKRIYHESKLVMPKPRAPYVRGDIEPYQSPIDDRPIMGMRDRREDFKRHGCRPYEGFEQENKEAERYRAEQDKKFEHSVGEAIEQTAAELSDGRTKPVKGGLITGF